MQLSFGLVTTLRCRYTATGILTSCMKEGLLLRGYSNSSSHLLTYNYCVKNPLVVAVNFDTACTITPRLVKVDFNVRPRLLKWCLYFDIFLLKF